MKYDVIVVGSGLSGLSCAFELVERGKKVLVLEADPIVGGRTASWDEDGMLVESGLHRFIGFYTHLPQLLKRAGININDMLYWEDEIEIRIPSGPSAVFGASLIRRPWRTISGALGNTHFLPWRDKLNFVRFVLDGLYDYFFYPDKLDGVTVLEYAKKRNVRPLVVERLLIPFTEGVFFLPISLYSAYDLFGLLGPYLPSLYRMGLGAFAGGMTEVMTGPLARAIEQRGGEVRTNSPVTRLLIRDESVVGVRLYSAEAIEANAVVIATSLSPAQEIIKKSLPDHLWFRDMLSLPTMPAVTLQIDLDKPSTPLDRTTFGPKTSLISFAEQSRTTFKHVPGRISIDLGQPQYFIKMSPREIFEFVARDATKIGIDLKSITQQYRVVAHPSDFYCLAPGMEQLRPTQKTPVPGLALAGDYTKQKYLCTMEGAVYSGKLAAEAILSTRSNTS